MIQSVLHQAIWGISANQNLFAESAQKVSRLPENSDSFSHEQDFLDGAVGMLQARSGVQSNLAVFRAADDMLGTLLDTLA